MTHCLVLDFDGVLHPEDVCIRRVKKKKELYFSSSVGHRLFEHCALLEELLKPYPEVRIVLSTSWVRVDGFDEAKSNLTQGLQDRVIGATYHSSMDRDGGLSGYAGSSFAHTSRYSQILQNMTIRGAKSWLALDDDLPDVIRAELRPHYVKTHPVLGISAPEVLEEIKQKLLIQFRGDR